MLLYAREEKATFAPLFKFSKTDVMDMTDYILTTLVALVTLLVMTVALLLWQVRRRQQQYRRHQQIIDSEEQRIKEAEQLLTSRGIHLPEPTTTPQKKTTNEE